MNANNTEYRANRDNTRAGCDPGTLGIFHPWQILVRRRWQLFSCLLLVCGLAVAATVYRKPSYEAITRVQIQDQSNDVAMPALLGRAQGNEFDTQFQLLQSRFVMSRAMEQLNGMEAGWYYNVEDIEPLREKLKVRRVDSAPIIEIIGVSHNRNEAAAIANQVTTAFVKTSLEMRQAANERLIERLKKQISTYDRKAENQEKQIQEYRQEYQISGVGGDLATVQGKISSIEQERTRLQMERLTLESKNNQLKELLSHDLPWSDSKRTAALIAGNTQVISLRGQINKLQQQESKVARVYLPGHTKLKNIRTQIEDLRNQLAQKKQSVTQNLHREIGEQYDTLVKREKSLKMMLAELKKTAVELTETNQQYARLLADLEITRRFRTECVARVQNYTLEEEMSEPPVVVIDEARIPIRPTGLNKSHQAASMLLLGMIFSVLFVLAWDRFSLSSAEAPQASTMPMYIPVPVDGQGMSMWPGGAGWVNQAGNPGVNSATPSQSSQSRQQQAHVSMASAASMTESFGKEAVELPIDRKNAPMHLGVIDCHQDGQDRMVFAARCQIIHTDPSSTQARIFREAGSQLLSRFGNAGQKVVITGTENNYGTTIVASNLALTLAQSGRRVLLVEGSSGPSSVSQVFSADLSQPGLETVVNHPETIDSAAQNTSIPNLAILPLASEDFVSSCNAATFSTLNKALSEKYDWVIYDAGSVKTDLTRMLLEATGKALLLAEQAEPHDRETLTNSINRCGAEILGYMENSLTEEYSVNENSNIDF